MNFPNIPDNLNLRLIPVTDSEVLSWTTYQDLDREHEEGDVIVVPDFISGDKAHLVFSKIGDYARVGKEKIEIYSSYKEVWDKACLDVIFLGEETIEISQAAKSLINSLDWWKVAIS